MRLRELLREATASARAQRVPTLMVVVLVAAMCVTTILTVGRTAGAEAQVAERLNSAGSRQLVVRDARSQGFLTSSVVGSVESLSTVERAVGLGIAFDASNAVFGSGGTAVAARAVTGDLSSAVRLTAGRWPNPGEALVSAPAMSALGLDEPVGSLLGSDGATFAIVGSYAPRAPFDALDGGAVVAASPGENAQALYVIARSAGAASSTQSAVLATLNREDPGDVTVESPVDLATVQQSVAGDLTVFGRGMLILVMGAGAVLVGVVVLADVLLRRRDLGRRRALGAARWMLVSLVVLRAALAAALGSTLGVLAGAAAASRTGIAPTVAFDVSVGVIAVLVTAATAVVPAVAAAWQDPVRVLRTP
ncbi:FtsX-like permease family protein [Cellulomonas soli]|uniref:ABC3 transporter permease C-terminal domain-containing protein n=1 Tax=Cellulomonas soli TaxID=931535 RepID=A0A512PD01_9CELL|nr:FtsX-like permease family protein [Cellulomonas soli]NYI58643.1 putative ABC transport system permease protein [Cellulomonas soli]GEP69068.1 hypothetical protein CSO01_17830 [Cellulomonas soli]